MNIKDNFLHEFIGTAALLVSVIGSGIMGETLASGNVAVALLANSIATGACLFIIISIFIKSSGAHFNPAVSLFSFLAGEMKGSHCAIYVVAQVLGAVCGVFLTHVMFDQSVIQISTTDRSGIPLLVSEVVATFGLIGTIYGFRNQAHQIPAAVAVYITGAYWFTSSTSFANPAVTIARMFSDTFAGIAPASVFGFIVVQCVVGILFGIYVRSQQTT